MKMQKSYLLIIIFSLIISCSNNSTNPDDDNNNTSSVKAITSGTYTIQYGSNTPEVDVTDKSNLQTLWIGLVGGKTVYKANDYKETSGTFDNNANYYDSTDTVNIRTKFIDCAVYEYNSKKYLTAIYWDNKNPGMPSSYRLVIFDETGAEQGWYGGGNDEAVIPDENTQWTKYDFVLGYLKTY